MPLRKLSKPSKPNKPRPADAGEQAETKKTKRQRIAAFFKSRKQKHAGEDKPTIPAPNKKATPRKAARDSKIAESSPPAKSNSSVEVVKPETEQPDRPDQPDQTPQQSNLPTPPPEPKDKQKEKDVDKVEPLTEEQIHALFSGAPQFSIRHVDGRPTPRALYPWDEELKVKDNSDSVPLAQPAFSAATLHRHLPTLKQSSDQSKIFQGYDMGVVEVPSMLSAQGIEPGTIGFVHFLELSKSDNLVTDLQASQSSNGYLEAMRNTEQMHNNPERLGIRRPDMSMIHDRLIELGDLFEAFHDSPERMTILNNQSSGDLYANLFGKFLMPPAYDGTVDDPLGLKVQIDTLLKILRLKGIWHVFSLVEWRIRLGQILWSDGEGLPEHSPHHTWLEREILLLQIVLACELLLRLDAVSSMDADYVTGQMHVTPEDYQGFLNLKTRKTDWDLVLARRFLENILVVKESQPPTPKPRKLLSMLSRDDPPQAPRDDIVLLPRHQARQLSGLLYFAETIQWPGTDMIVKELAQKLGVSDGSKEPSQPASPYGKFLEPSTPSSTSVYGTPLATPRSSVTIRDSYFGNTSTPALSRHSSRSLTIPLSTTLLTNSESSSANTMNVGGWLSRSYLTGLVLPGEGISHFLMSTMLENDKLAIAALGDSANLYGGVIYEGRSWWSKSSIIGRVLACLEGSLECMGWITISKPPEALPSGWYALDTVQLGFEQPVRIEADEDLLARDSALILGTDYENVNPEYLKLALDPVTPPIPSVEHTGWHLTLITPDISDNESASPSDTESTYTASVTFTSFGRGVLHTLTLSHDVQFITSFPCTPPAASPILNIPKILNPSPPHTLSRSSSKRSIHSARSSARRLSRLSRRNSHGFEPLFSHPPDSPSIEPTPLYAPMLDKEPEQKRATSPMNLPMMVHPLHTSYKYKVVPITDVLDPNFVLPFPMHAYDSSLPVSPLEDRYKEDEGSADETTVLVLDARASRELEVLARAWCAEKGLHAIVGRVARTCLACCVREARGLGVRVVVRV